MTIRKLKLGEKLKEKEYVINSETSGLLAVKLNTKKIYELTLGLIGCSIEENYGIEEKERFGNFLKDNMELLIETMEEEIEYIIDSFGMAFCTLKDDFNSIKRNFNNIGKRIENLIVFLIWKHVGTIMTGKYQEEMEL